MPWYALYTQARQEKKIADQLSKVGVEVYCPMMKQIRQWSDRKKEIQTPLITSYVFVKLNELDRNLVFQIRGVIRYLFWLGRPAIIKDEEILVLKNALVSTVESINVSVLQPGDFMKVPTGLFEGKEGMVKSLNKNRLQLVIRELGFLITITR